VTITFTFSRERAVQCASLVNDTTNQAPRRWQSVCRWDDNGDGLLDTVAIGLVIIPIPRRSIGHSAIRSRSLLRGYCQIQSECDRGVQSKRHIFLTLALSGLCKPDRSVTCSQPVARDDESLGSDSRAYNSESPSRSAKPRRTRDHDHDD